MKSIGANHDVGFVPHFEYTHLQTPRLRLDVGEGGSPPDHHMQVEGEGEVAAAEPLRPQARHGDLGQQKKREWFREQWACVLAGTRPRNCSGCQPRGDILRYS